MRTYILAAIVAHLGFGIASAAQTAVVTSKSVTKNYGGSFGAELQGTYSHSYDTVAATSSSAVSGSLDGRVMGLKIPLAKGSADLVASSSSSTSKGTLKAAGMTVLSWDKTLSNTETWATTKIVKSVDTGKFRYSVGPVSLAVRLTASVSLWAEATATITPSPVALSLPATVELVAGPCADAACGGSAAIDIIVLGAGVDGSLRLGAHRVLGRTKLRPVSEREAWVDYGATMNSDGTNGRIRAFVSIGIKVWFFKLRRTFYHTIYKANGAPSSDPLWAGTTRVL